MRESERDEREESEERVKIRVKTSVQIANLNMIVL